MRHLSTTQKIGLAGILLAFLFSLYFSLGGVDYGPQWDQNLIKGHLNKYVRQGTLLPGEYIYPPVSSYIAGSTLIPYAGPFVARYGLNWTPTQEYLLQDVLKNPNESFLLNLRSVFVLFTVLAVLWTGLAAMQYDWRAGVVAALALGTSWEVVYHSRFVHPDGPTMQFSALALLFGMLAYFRRGSLKPDAWLGLAAAAAAVATATKYTAGLSIVTVFVFAYGVYSQQGWRLRKMLLSLVGLGAIFGAVFVALTPGVLLETQVFLQNLGTAQRVYSQGHGLQTLPAGAEYLWRVINYLLLAAFSHAQMLALVVPALAAAGVVALARKRERQDVLLAIALAGAPLIYILFLATNRVLFVRNLLQILPNLAVLAGIGFVWGWERLRAWRGGAQYGLAVLAAVVFAFNGYWIWQTTVSIQQREQHLYIEEAIAAIEDAAEDVYVTPAALRLLEGAALPGNAKTAYGGEAQVLFAYLSDALDEMEGYWPVNLAGAAPQVFGPKEINFDWHASWPGVERLVLAERELAWQDGSLAGVGLGADDAVQAETAVGVLRQDGEQFNLEADGRTIRLLNSAEPRVILALRGLVDSEIELAGQPHSAARPDDWFAAAVGGEALVGEAELEFHTVRYLANRTAGELACIADAVGDAQYEAMVDNMLPMVDLTAEELEAIAACAE